MNHYYIYHEDEVVGPYDVEQLREIAASGLLSTESLVCLEGASDWQAATTVEGLFEEEASVDVGKGVQQDGSVDDDEVVIIEPEGSQEVPSAKVSPVASEPEPIFSALHETTEEEAKPKPIPFKTPAGAKPGMGPKPFPNVSKQGIPVKKATGFAIKSPATSGVQNKEAPSSSSSLSDKGDTVDGNAKDPSSPLQYMMSVENMTPVQRQAYEAAMEKRNKQSRNRKVFAGLGVATLAFLVILYAVN